MARGAGLRQLILALLLFFSSVFVFHYLVFGPARLSVQKYVPLQPNDYVRYAGNKLTETTSKPASASYSKNPEETPVFKLQEGYDGSTKVPTLEDRLKLNGKPYYTEPTKPDIDDIKVNATLVSLARNSDLDSLLSSIASVEEQFNKEYKYSWVFLNEQEFTDEFVSKTTKAVSGKTYYGFIEPEHWSVPSWINMTLAKQKMQEMEDNDVIYGGSLPYRHMCRYESGFFYRHPLMQQFEYYWRVEPGIEILCKVDYDPFKFMKATNKLYGFVISLYEYGATVPTLWETTMNFIKEKKDEGKLYIHPNAGYPWVTEDEYNSYNLCHFWSNFEIASMELWRSPVYMEYFDYLDKAGGFFYERWGDAPVHSLAVALFIDKKQVHFFNDIGYVHPPFVHCPTQKIFRPQCNCKDFDSFDFEGYSCTTKWHEVMGWEINRVDKAQAEKDEEEYQKKLKEEQEKQEKEKENQE